MGGMYMFFVVDRAWLHDKYIRWRWLGAYTHTFTSLAQIWDGEYDRSSMVDFPSGAGRISKGNGLLQTLDSNVGSFAMETKDIQADTSGGSEEKCTIAFFFADSWNAQQGYLELDWIEINTGAGGAGPINDEQFTDAIVPEQTGTTADYGYIGYGEAGPSLDDANLAAGFIVRQPGSEDLPAGFDQQIILDLSAEFIVRRDGSQDLGASFDGQAVQNLPAVFCVHTVRVAQDLAEWTEYDSGAFLTHDCNQVEWTDLTRAATDTALTKTDLPSGLGTRVFHRLEANLYAVEETPNGATERVILWAGHLADVSHDFYGQNDFEIVALILHATSIADQYQLELREKGGNSSFMLTTWPNFQSRYIQIYKEGAYIRASVWQTDAYDKGTLDDWCEINLSGDLDFDYVSVAMSYGQAGAETSSGYVDPIFGSFEYVKFQFVVRQSGDRGLPAEFIVRHPDNQELLGEFDIRRDGSQDLPAEFIVRQLTDEELLGEFVARRDGSQELGASFDAQATQSLLAEFVVRRDASQDLAAKFAVNYWYHVSHLVINTGAITAGSVEDTRADDGSDLILAELAGAPGFDYEFHWKNVPAGEIFGVRINGWYDGNLAHLVNVYQYNFVTPGWELLGILPDAVAEQDYVWMAGGPDYISGGGEFRLWIDHPGAGNPGHTLNIDYLWLDESYSEDQELLGEFIARQPGSANLLGAFIVRHPGSQDLGASFDGQVSLNLPSEFSSRRSTQQELIASFTVNQASRDLPGEFVSRQPGSQSLPCKINIIAFLTLPAEFVVQNNVALEVPGAFSTRRDAAEEFSAEFIVRPDFLGDLLAEFSVLHGPPQLEPVIIAEDPDDWINAVINVGTGFLANLMGGIDAETKVIGASSYRSRINYKPDEHDYIKFGHRFKSWMQHDKAEEIYSKYALCPDLDRELVASLATNINLCTLNREIMIRSPTSDYSLSTAVT